MVDERLKKKRKQQQERVKDADQLVQLAERPWLVFSNSFLRTSGVEEDTGLEHPIETQPFKLFLQELQRKKRFSRTPSKEELRAAHQAFTALTKREQAIYFLAATQNREVIVKLLRHIFSGKSLSLDEKRKQLQAEVATAESIRARLRPLNSQRQSANKNPRKKILPAGGVARRFGSIDLMDISDGSMKLKAQLMATTR